MSSRTRLVVVVAAIAASSAAAAPTPGAPRLAERLPRPATNDYVRGERGRIDATCRACHAAITRDHDTSRHHAAWSDPAFQGGYALEKDAFCRSCHAPESPPSAEPDPWAASSGVACVTCHQPESGPVLASTRATPSRAPHPVARSADFGTRACARCHEFSFPNAESFGERGLMQKTLSEHAAARARGDADGGQACTECHMRGARPHGFDVGPLLASAVGVSVERIATAQDSAGQETYAFVVRAKGAGHAIPTGDLFRRVVLRIHVGRATREHVFGRSFRSRRDETGRVVRVEAGDNRLAPSQRLEIGVPAVSSPRRWELAYQRVTAVDQAPPFDTRVEDETVLTSGTF